MKLVTLHVFVWRGGQGSVIESGGSQHMCSSVLFTRYKIVLLRIFEKIKY